MTKLSEGDDVLSSVADLKLVELVLEGLHDGRSVADRVNQNDTKTSGKMQVFIDGTQLMKPYNKTDFSST